jgi:SAM-dependent methyltransferase
VSKTLPYYVPSNIDEIRRQFGRSSLDYVRCPVQAGDYTLARLVELVKPLPHWFALDVATGAGHTAILVSNYVNNVLAIDATPEMLDAAIAFAKSNSRSNIQFQQSDAHNLPCFDSTVDLVTCRLAVHHFTDVPRFFSEAYRVLKPGGVLAIIDSHLPHNVSFSEINKIQKVQDSSHVSCLTREKFEAISVSTGFLIDQIEEGSIRLGFRDWITRGRVAEKQRDELRHLMRGCAHPDTAAVLKIENDAQQDFTFSFQRIIMICKKPSAV